MRSMLVSLSPKECVNLFNGDLSILVRKVKPKCDLPIDAYIYCTKEAPYGVIEIKWDNANNILGKVVAKFTLNKMEEIKLNGKIVSGYSSEINEDYITNSLHEKDLLNKSCLSFNELDNYLQSKNGYAWHIDNLVIFDKPKEIGEFEHQVIYENVYTNEKRYVREPLRKAPKNYCYIEV